MKRSFLLLSAVICLYTAQAQQLDDNFNAGLVEYSLGNLSKIKSIVPYGSEGVYWVGYAPGDQFDIVVGRTLNDGSLDPGFADSGMSVISRAENTFEWGYDMLVQSDGKLVIGASGLGSQSMEVMLCRLNTNGSLDTTFGIDGFATVALNSDALSDTMEEMAFDPNGNIVVVGTDVIGSNSRQVVVMRFTPEGALDDGFGTNGILDFAFGDGPGQDRPDGLLVDDQGRIIIAGETYTNGSPSVSDFGVARLLSDGSFDTSFGTNGVSTIDVGVNGDEDICYGISALNNDSYLLLGSVRTNPNPNISAVVKITADGEPDPAFGNEGKLIFDPGETALSFNSRAVKAVEMEDGSIIINGGISSVLESNYLLKIDASGIIDESFGTSGYFYMGAEVNYLPEDMILSNESVYSAVTALGPNMPSGIFKVHLGDIISVAESTSPKTILYPNPCKDFLQLQSDALTGEGLVSIYDLRGSLVLEKIVQFTGAETIDLTGLIDGAYLITIKTENGFLSELFVKGN